MKLLIALALGMGAAAASFGILWLTIRHSLHSARPPRWAAVCQVVRLVGCASVFCAVSQEGFGPIVSALGGFWIMRWHLIRRLGEH